MRYSRRKFWNVVRGMVSGGVAMAGHLAAADGDAAVNQVKYDQITLANHRVYAGHLNDERNLVEVIDPATGKTVGAVQVQPDDIVSVVPKTAAVAETSAQKLARMAAEKGAEKAAAKPVAAPVVVVPPDPLTVAENKVVAAVQALNTVKQQQATAVQEDLDYDRTEGGRSGKVFTDHDAWQASIDKLAGIKKRMKDCAAQIPVDAQAYKDALAAYRAMGGTRDFSSLLVVPKQPK